jgi:hypothetical protein
MQVRYASLLAHNCVASCRERYANDNFSGKLQDKFMTNWRGVWKNPEICLSSMILVTKTSLWFYTGVTFWDI